MFGSVFVLFAVPYIDVSQIRSATFRPVYRVFYWTLLIDFALMFWVGQKKLTDFTILLGQYMTIYYYVFFLILLPISGRIERAAHKADRIPIKQKAPTKIGAFILLFF